MSTREVVLTGGCPWGFRMYGGCDVNHPLKISRVNPGRKAALSGIREGDVISSINGKPTHGMTNTEAQDMLKQSAPVLRLGLNESHWDSFGRPSLSSSSSLYELKRPSELLSQFQNTTPHPPVYATVKTRDSPFRTLPSPKKTTLHTVPNLNPTEMVKNIVTDEKPNYYPLNTNPFYSTLPSEAKIQNGSSNYSSLERPFRKNVSNNVSQKYYDNYSSYSRKHDKFMHRNSNREVKPIGKTYNSYNETKLSENQSTRNNIQRNFENKIKTANVASEYLNKEDIYYGTENESKRDHRFNKFHGSTRSLDNQKTRNYLETNSENKSNKLKNGPDCLSREDIYYETKKECIINHPFAGIHGSTNSIDKANTRSYSETNPEAKIRKSNIEPECLSKEDIYYETKVEGNKNHPFAGNFDNFDQYCKTFECGKTAKSNNNTTHTNSKNPFSDYSYINDNLSVDTSKCGTVIEKTTVSEEKLTEIEEVRTVKKIVLQAPEYDFDDMTNVSNEGKTLSNGYHDFDSCTQTKSAYGHKVPAIAVGEGDGVQTTKSSLTSLNPIVTPLITVTNPRRFTAVAKESGHNGLNAKTVMIGPTFKATSPAPAVWTPGQPSSFTQTKGLPTAAAPPPTPPPPPPKPVWQPSSAGPSPVASRKHFKPVNFDEVNRKCEESQRTNSLTGPPKQNGFVPQDPPPPPRFPTSQSVPSDGFKSYSNRLPSPQNPTVTLLQKAREGQLPRGASYIQEQQQKAREERPPTNQSSSSGWRSSGYASEPEGGSRSMSINRSKVVEGIGPTTKDGMPVALRSEVKDQSKWYKKMYETIHRNKYDDNQIKVHYKSPRASPSVQSSSVSRSSNYAGFENKSGYLSEPEGSSRRRRVSSNDAHTDSELLSPYLPSEKYSTLASARAHQEVYRNQPGRIENYVPGKSSVVEKESKQWWDEVMDIFDGWLDENSPFPDYPAFLARALRKTDLTKTSSQPVRRPKESVTSSILAKSNMARALKDGGYESDSTLVFRRRGGDAPLSPKERSQAYRVLQAGGEPPLKGFRSPAPQSDDTEIEYIPLSPTLTKIRIHKKSPKKQEIICYPSKQKVKESKKVQKYAPSFISINIPSRIEDLPPSPPRRSSSKYNITLKSGVGKTKSNYPIKKMASKDNSNVNQLRDKLASKFNVHEMKRRSPPKNMKPRSLRVTNQATQESSKCVNRPNIGTESKLGTSSFISSRKTMSPLKYANPSECRFNKQLKTSVPISGGAGRRTPITKILDRISSIDKMWNAERNKKIEDKTTNKVIKSVSLPKIITKKDKMKLRGATFNQNDNTTIIANPLARGRTLIRTCDKLNVNKEGLKCRNLYPKNKNIVLKSIIKDRENIKSTSVIKLKEQNRTMKNEIQSKSSINHDKPKRIEDNSSESNGTRRENSNVIAQTPVSVSCDESIFTSFESLDRFMAKNEFVDLNDRSLNILTVKNYSDFCKSRFMDDFKSNAKINQYLLNKKPVTSSKFILWDRFPGLHSVQRSLSPRSHSLPDKKDNYTVKNQLLTYNETLSNLSVSTSRSKSEPSVKKLYFSQTSRPQSPQVIFHKKYITSKTTKSLPRLYFSQTIRPISPSFNKSSTTKEVMTRSQSSSTLQSQQTSYSGSDDMKENFHREVTPTSKLYFSETSKPISPNLGKNRVLKSLNSPQCIRSPSNRKIQNLQNQRKPHDLVVRKNTLRTRSAGDNEPEKASETDEIIRSYSNMDIYDSNYDCNTKAQNKKILSDRFRELNKYYKYLEKIHELQQATSALDVRLRRKNEKIIDFDRWKKMKCKERTEDELKKAYEQLNKIEKENDFNFLSDEYKYSKWNDQFDTGLKMREQSVEDLRMKFQDTETKTDSKIMHSNKKRGSNTFDKQLFESQNYIDSELTELGNKIGFSNRLWSSLTTEQVNTLKHQLNAIYGKEKDLKRKQDDFSVHVSVDSFEEKPILKVRSNSYPAVVDATKTDTSNRFGSLERFQKNKQKVIPNTLSESDKRAISKSISKEVLKRIALQNNHPYSRISKDNLYKKDFGEMSPSPTSETGSSSNSSAKTVICQNNLIPTNISNEGVREKVEYFENVTSTCQHSPITIYQPCEESEISDDETIIETPEYGSIEIKDQLCKSDSMKSLQNKNIRSRSCSNFKEYFGETALNAYSSLPHTFSTRASATNFGTKQNTPEVMIESGNARASRSRSNSPDPEKYWRAYLYLTRSGEVGRLTKKFEASTLRRHKSDPELARRILFQEWPRLKKMSGLSVDELTFRYESKSKLYRRKAISPTPLRDRFMPHIDVISKTASLERRSSSTPENSKLCECRSGEVQRLRSVFEKNARENRLTVSAPDVRYLSGQWIAHKFPRKRDNNRSSMNGHFVSGRISPVRRPRSTPSTARSEWNPEVHRPVSRYVPPRPSVSFQDADFAPTPPLKGISNGLYRFLESPRRQYVESDVNIHYKCPVRRDPLPHVPEKELARLQAEHMRRVYQEERRRKYMQELQDLQSRRHTDNFTPSQKTIVPLNRYDDAPVTASTRTKARVLYDFASQTPRELNLKKGDIVMIRRQIDANWYEGEHSGKVGLFPYNYVEIIKTSEVKTTPVKPVHEGRARAKFDFVAQTNLELPLRKGELVVLIRKVDENWWEGRLGNKIGIFPDSYIQVLDEPTGGRTEPTSKPVASPASHGLMNGTARTSMGPHSYTPQLNSPALSNAPQPNQPLITNSTSTYKAARIVERTTVKSPAPHDITNKPLYIDTNAEPIPYRAMYKYKPQNPDELELLEGDTVLVVEKCDDGWFVGTSTRTQRFGTFPGNYVERIA